MKVEKELKEIANWIVKGGGRDRVDLKGGGGRITFSYSFLRPERKTTFGSARKKKKNVTLFKRAPRRCLKSQARILGPDEPAVGKRKSPRPVGHGAKVITFLSKPPTEAHLRRSPGRTRVIGRGTSRKGARFQT